MSYTTKKHAKLFETEEEANDCIRKFPEWTKKEKYIVEELTIFETII